MTNKEYYDTVSEYVKQIESCIENTMHIANEVIGKTFFSFDLYFWGMMDRNIYLAKGFIQMLKDRNLTCAGALLRLQLDNCMRLLAISIAEDENQVIDCVINGGNISKLKDKNGKKMTDTYLKHQMNQYDKQLSGVYNQASGFVHFSGKAVYQSIVEWNEKDFRLILGGELPEKRNDPLIECAQAFCRYYRLFLHFMKYEAEWKKNYEKSLEE